MQNIRLQVLLFNFVFSGLGCDTAAVVSILAHRDATQRALIQQEYRTMYSDDLIKRLTSELHGKLEVAILYLLMNSFRLRSVEHIRIIYADILIYSFNSCSYDILHLSDSSSALDA
jgi:hypothetical protein